MPLGQPLGDRLADRAGRGLPYNKHLAGGIKGWKEAGLPTDY